MSSGSRTSARVQIDRRICTIDSMGSAYLDECIRTVWWIQGARRLTGMTATAFQQRLMDVAPAIKAGTLESFMRGSRALPLMKKGVNAERYFFAAAKIEPRSLSLYFEPLLNLIEELRWWNEPDRARRIFISRYESQIRLAIIWVSSGQTLPDKMLAYRTNNHRSCDRLQRIRWAMLHLPEARRLFVERATAFSEYIERQNDLDLACAIRSARAPCLDSFTLYLALAAEALALGDRKRRDALVPHVERHAAALQDTPIKRWASDLLMMSMERLNDDRGWAFTPVSAQGSRKLRPMEILALSFEPRLTFMSFEEMANLWRYPSRPVALVSEVRGRGHKVTRTGS